MRKKIEITDKCFKARLISLLCSSVALLLIPFIQLLPDKASLITSRFIAVLFWIGFILVVVFTIKISSLIKKFDVVNIDDEDIKYRKIPGILTFTFGVKHIILYLIIIMSFMLLLSDMIFHYLSEFIMFPLLSILFLAFVIHCIIDGKNYKTYIKIREGMEKRV